MRERTDDERKRETIITVMQCDVCEALELDIDLKLLKQWFLFFS